MDYVPENNAVNGRGEGKCGEGKVNV